MFDWRYNNCLLFVQTDGEKLPNKSSEMFFPKTNFWNRQRRKYSLKPL